MTAEHEKILVAYTRMDKKYQALLSQLSSLEADYQRIMTALPEAEREILERYIALCEELEYRRTCIAIKIKKDSLG